MIKLNPSTHAAIAKLVRQDNYPKVAAGANAISETTFAEWMAEAAKGVEPYKQLKADIDRAEEDAENDLVEVVKTHARNGHKESIEFLKERAIPLD